MNKPEWMPENPFPKAELASLEYYERNAWHRGSVITAKELLEYLIALAKDYPADDKWNEHFIREKELQSMLKQLEGQNG